MENFNIFKLFSTNIHFCASIFDIQNQTQCFAYGPILNVPAYSYNAKHLISPCTGSNTASANVALQSTSSSTFTVFTMSPANFATFAAFGWRNLVLLVMSFGLTAGFLTSFFDNICSQVLALLATSLLDMLWMYRASILAAMVCCLHE